MGIVGQLCLKISTIVILHKKDLENLGIISWIFGVFLVPFGTFGFGIIVLDLLCRKTGGLIDECCYI